MKRILVSHHQNIRQNNGKNTDNKPSCVDMLKGWKTNLTFRGRWIVSHFYTKINEMH